MHPMGAQVERAQALVAARRHQQHQHQEDAAEERQRGLEHALSIGAEGPDTALVDPGTIVHPVDGQVLYGSSSGSGSSSGEEEGDSADEASALLISVVDVPGDAAKTKA